MRATIGFAADAGTWSTRRSYPQFDACIALSSGILGPCFGRYILRARLTHRMELLGNNFIRYVQYRKLYGGYRNHVLEHGRYHRRDHRHGPRGRYRASGCRLRMAPPQEVRYRTQVLAYGQLAHQLHESRDHADCGFLHAAICVCRCAGSVFIPRFSRAFHRYTESFSQLRGIMRRGSIYREIP